MQFYMNLFFRIIDFWIDGIRTNPVRTVLLGTGESAFEIGVHGNRLDDASTSRFRYVADYLLSPLPVETVRSAANSGFPVALTDLASKRVRSARLAPESGVAA